MDQFLAGVQKRAFQMARIAVGCDQDALDIVQDAMLGLVKNYSHKAEEEWHCLFYKILQSRIYDYHRRSQLKQRLFGWLGLTKDKALNEQEDPVQQAEDSQGVSPEKQLQYDQTTQQLVDAVAMLPIRQQQAFLLRLWEGMSVAETAKTMAVSEGSVKTHYSRALNALRSQLEGYW